jgi:hypothetical protein
MRIGALFEAAALAFTVLDKVNDTTRGMGEGM